VKEYQDEFFVRHALILDTFAAGGQEEVFEEAVSVAASFACTVMTQESLLDLLFVGAQAFCLTTGRGVGQVEQALELLAGVQPCQKQSFETLRNLVLQHAALVSGCVGVFLSWDEPRRELVRQLRGQGLPVLALVLAHPAPGQDLDELKVAAQKEQCHILQTGQVAEGLLALEGIQA
jgi:uncharacterized protein (DUF58 family)